MPSPLHRRPSHRHAPAARLSTRRRAAATVAAAALLLAGCSGEAEPDGPSPAHPTTQETPVSSTPSADLPTGVVGEQASWVLDQIDPAQAPDAGAVGDHVAQSMLDQVPASQLVEVFTALAATGPWVPRASVQESDSASVTIEDTAGTFLDMQIVLDEEGLITGLLFQPGSDPERAPAASWDELDAAVSAMGVDAEVLVSTVHDDGSTTPVHSIGDPEGVRPLGSIFKLYVLGAVVQAVEDGDLTWETPLTLTDDVRSLPSGTLQEEPAGTTVTVEEAATGMISISDNTATDLLVAAVGRDSVGRAMAAMGHHDRALNDPFLTTRDLFWLGWGADEAGADWATLSAAERSAVLESAPTGLLSIDPTKVTTARWQDGLDWFATPQDLVAAHVTLQDYAKSAAGEPVGRILSANPGITVDSTTWPYVAFKGGSAPGVLAGSWYAEAADGSAVVVTVQLSAQDPAEIPSVADFAHLAEDALTLAAG